MIPFWKKGKLTLTWIVKITSYFNNHCQRNNNTRKNKKCQKKMKKSQKEKKKKLCIY